MDINGLRTYQCNCKGRYHSGDRGPDQDALHLSKKCFGVNSFRVGSDEFVSLALRLWVKRI